MKKFTVRLDEDLSQLFTNIKNRNFYNLSAIVREALKEKLSVFLRQDNREEQPALEKGASHVF